MKIGIAADHHGVRRKEKIKNYLEHLGHEVMDYGSNTVYSVDYPEYAFKVGEALKEEIELGILICGSGIGMSIAANKVKGVRCALVHNTKEAKLARLHNDANVVALSASMNMIRIKDILDVFINTKFSNIERHSKRVEIINNYK